MAQHIYQKVRQVVDPVQSIRLLQKDFTHLNYKLGDKLGSLSQDIFECMSTAAEDVSLALTLTSLHADRDDLPKNLPKTTGQESKTSTSV